MIIVIPVSKADFKECLNIFAFINAIKHFGPYLDHELLIVTRPSDHKYAMVLQNSVAYLFSKVTLHVFSEDGPNGWPQGPNFYWKNTIDYFKWKCTENDKPWFWMELDCLPLKPKWPDILEDEYKKQGKPCLGVIQNTVAITSDLLKINIGEHLQGTAIYPPKFHEICSVWEYVDRLPTAFDVICQWEIIPNTYNSKLIQQGFRTINYKIHHNPFKIQGEDNGDFDGVTSYNTPLDQEAVIHHGCKDTSLADIVTSPVYNSWLKELEL